MIARGLRRAWRRRHEPSNVGIVIVSHSPEVAGAPPTWCARWSATRCRCAWCGGDPAAGSAPIVEAIWRRSTGPGRTGGVAILVDLGGAETNSEMAIEMLPRERARRVVVCNAPIVEGAVMAATEASGGASLDAVRAHRRGAVRRVSDRT